MRDHIQLRFVEFHLEKQYDTLEVGFGYNITAESTIVKISGEIAPVVIVHDKFMWLRFRSDESVTEVGFYAYLQVSVTGKTLFYIL